jgi:hypothetical protein
MQVGSLVTPKKDVQFPLTLIMLLMLNGGQLPVHGTPYEVEEFVTFFCDNCKEEHTQIRIDGVDVPIAIWPVEYFVELQPPQEIKIENIIQELLPA